MVKNKSQPKISLFNKVIDKIRVHLILAGHDTTSCLIKINRV